MTSDRREGEIGLHNCADKRKGGKRNCVFKNCELNSKMCVCVMVVGGRDDCVVSN